MKHLRLILGAAVALAAAAAPAHAEEEAAFEVLVGERTIPVDLGRTFKLPAPGGIAVGAELHRSDRVFHGHGITFRYPPDARVQMRDKPSHVQISVLLQGGGDILIQRVAKATITPEQYLELSIQLVLKNVKAAGGVPADPKGKLVSGRIGTERLEGRRFSVKSPEGEYRLEFFARVLAGRITGVTITLPAGPGGREDEVARVLESVAATDAPAATGETEIRIGSKRFPVDADGKARVTLPGGKPFLVSVRERERRHRVDPVAFEVPATCRVDIVAPDDRAPRITVSSIDRFIVAEIYCLGGDRGAETPEEVRERLTSLREFAHGKYVEGVKREGFPVDSETEPVRRRILGEESAGWVAVVHTSDLVTRVETHAVALGGYTIVLHLHLPEDSPEHERYVARLVESLRPAE